MARGWQAGICRLWRLSTRAQASDPVNGPIYPALTKPLYAGVAHAVLSDGSLDAELNALALFREPARSRAEEHGAIHCKWMPLCMAAVTACVRSCTQFVGCFS
jgi:hypothetical protein